MIELSFQTIKCLSMGQKQLLKGYSLKDKCCLGRNKRKGHIAPFLFYSKKSICINLENLNYLPESTMERINSNTLLE